MKNIFNSIQVKRIKTNTFDLTHDVKQSMKMGNLTPCLVMECSPGDRFKISPDSLTRFAPLVSPVMHRYDQRIEYFFVPNRIVWEGWEDFITNKAEGTLPNITYDGTLTASQQKFLDYMGVPPWNSVTPVQGVNISAIPLAAYQMIYNEYYRDQNMIAEIPYKLPDAGGNIAVGIYATMRERAWEHDYFTAALPTAQAGNDVDIPLGTVELNPNWFADGQQPKIEDSVGNLGTGALSGQAAPDGITTPSAPSIVAFDPDGSLNVGATTINTLRRAFRLQEWLEKAMRGGQRYIEMLYSLWDEKSKDSRLQRPEYIVGTKTPVVISEVLNTTGTDGQLPQGNMAGHAVAVGFGNDGYYKCDEHGYIIGIISIIPRTAYCQGLPKHWLKFDNFDYYVDTFAHLGEQPIQNQEIYAYGATNEDTFGYIPRYAEYKYLPSRLAGDFRNNLAHWTSVRQFSALPTLSEDFISVDESDSAIEQIFAVQDDDDYLYCHILHKIHAKRKMAVFGTPQI